MKRFPPKSTDNRINAGSMADIAFLLLIFFLVTTTIIEDKGLLVRLPSLDSHSESIDVADNNVLSVLLNADDELLIEEQLADISSLKSRTIEFISNPNKRTDLSDSPKKAVVSLQNDRGTKYKAYVQVYNEIKAAYNQLRNEEAQKRYNRSFNNCTREQGQIIRNEIPMIISEAEPTSFGEEN